MYKTRDFAEVIRGRLKKDGTLAAQVEKEHCAVIAESFAYYPKLLSKLGEMIAQEKRTAIALARVIAAAIRARPTP